MATKREVLGEFEQLVLFALLQLDNEAYGAAVREAIEGQTGRDVNSGAVYITLERLESRALVSSRWGEPTAARGGRRRRYYSLRPAGAVLLQRSYTRLQRMAHGVLPRLETLARRAGTVDR